MTGEAGRFGDPEFGPNVYYGIDIMAHQITGSLEVTLTGSSATSDPRVIVVERRSSENVLLLQPPESSNVYSLPVPDGSFFIMVYNDANVAAPYQIAARVVP